MRCPKCSYISFDHLDACQKCGKNLAEIAGQIHGTSLKVEPPVFLGTALEALAATPAFDDEMGAAGSGLSLVEDDADISIGGETEEAASEAEMDAPFQDEDEFDFQMDADPDAIVEESSSETSIDTALEQETEEELPPEQPEQAASSTEGAGLDFEGLDLSDLSPEAAAEATAEAETETPAKDEEEPFDLWSLEESAEGTDAPDIFEDMDIAGKTPPGSEPSSGESEPAADTADSDSSEDEVS